jgi:hypothetical protein
MAPNMGTQAPPQLLMSALAQQVQIEIPDRR